MTADQAADTPQERPVVGPVSGDALHIMSYNLKYASQESPHAWPDRRPLVAALLRREQPTVIGTQEGLYPQLKDIARDLPPRYGWIGQGRDGGSRGEFAAVFYDGDRLEPEAYDSYWLSRKPQLVGSRSWARLARIVTWVRFTDRRTGNELVVVNTHLDHQYPKAQVRGAGLLRAQVDTLTSRFPVVVTGDFNVAGTPATRTYQILTGGGLVDTWHAAKERLTPGYGTYGGYRAPVIDGDRIDWVLTSEQFVVHTAAINPFAVAGTYPSDHLPVQAVVSVH